jgi:predicted component of type VI protein secretion system
MARLYLKLDNVVVREYPLSDAPVTIGRLADNTIHVDSLSVSGHHARLAKENEGWVLYDENSTNGTYVNGQKVTRTVLVPGDTVHVGRHIIEFSDEPNAVAEAPAVPSPAAAPVVTTPVEAAPEAPVAQKAPVAVVTVLSGKCDQHEYVLTGQSNVIGKSEAAAVRLTRWFAPKVAATILQRDGHYYITESKTPIAVRVNSEAVHVERRLAPGDTILVDEVSLSFSLRG